MPMGVLQAINNSNSLATPREDASAWQSRGGLDTMGLVFVAITQELSEITDEIFV